MTLATALDAVYGYLPHTIGSTLMRALDEGDDRAIEDVLTYLYDAGHEVTRETAATLRYEVKQSAIAKAQREADRAGATKGYIPGGAGLPGGLSAILLALVLPLAAGAAVPKVNVNTANLEQLSYLPHVGPARAAAIVEARGGASGQRFFGSVKDFCSRVKGLSGGRCRDLSPYVIVGRGATTATGPLPAVPTIYEDGRVWYVCPAPDPDGDVSHVLATHLPCSETTD